MSLNNLVEINSFAVPGEGNVYSKTMLESVTGSKKLMVATLKKKVLLFEFSETAEDTLTPSTRELSFSFPPNGGEIVSMDAFNKSENVDNLVIGITTLKMNPDKSYESWLNIYSVPESEHGAGQVFDIDSVAQNCSSQTLKYIPYQLTHTYLLHSSGQPKEIVWLLSGGDQKIHLFMEDSTSHNYVECDLGEYLPELCHENASNVMRMDIQYSGDLSRRFSALGFENGWFNLYIVDPVTNAVLGSVSDGQAYPINHVMLFSLDPTNNVLVKSKVSGVEHELVDSAKEKEKVDNDLHCLSCTSYGRTSIYMNVLGDNYRKKYLRADDRNDLFLSSCAADIDLDRRNELLLGTWCEKVFSYKFENDEWVMDKEPLLVGHHVQHLEYADLDGDEVPELVVHTYNGVHVFQHEPECLDRILNFPIEEEDSSSQENQGSFKDLPSIEADSQNEVPTATESLDRESQEVSK